MNPQHKMSVLALELHRWVLTNFQPILFARFTFYSHQYGRRTDLPNYRLGEPDGIPPKQPIQVAPRTRGAPGFDGAQLTTEERETRRLRSRAPGNLICTLFLFEYPKGRLLSFGLTCGDRGRRTRIYHGDHGDQPRVGCLLIRLSRTRYPTLVERGENSIRMG